MHQFQWVSIRKRPTGGEQVPFRVESPTRPLIVYKDYLKFILKRNKKNTEMKEERRNMTPPDFFFSTRFLGNWCSTTSRAGKNSFVPRYHSHTLSEPSPCLKQKACSSWAVQGSRTSTSSVPVFVLTQLDLLPLNFFSARPARFHGLKLSQTLLALHLTQYICLLIEKSTYVSGAFQDNRCDIEEARNDRGDKVSKTLTHFCYISYG